MPSAERKTRCGMNRWMSGGVALGLAAAGTLAFAGPGSAQGIDLRATVDPTSIGPNDTVSIFSNDDSPCLFTDENEEIVPGRLTFLMTHPDGSTDDIGGPEDLVADAANPDGNGHWNFEISLVDQDNNPVPFDIGTYTIQVTCTEDQVEGGPEPEVVDDYNPLTFNVTEAPGEPTEPPADPPAAPPVVRTPDNGTG
jgi:hypothetical protein